MLSHGLWQRRFAGDPAIIDRAITHLKETACDSVRSFCPVGKWHPAWMSQLIDDRVVLEQKRLLAHTDISVKELAERTGFEEPTNLVKFFRQRTGTTPQAFRSQMIAVHTDGSGGADYLSDGKSLEITPSYTPDGEQPEAPPAAPFVPRFKQEST